MRFFVPVLISATLFGQTLHFKTERAGKVTEAKWTLKVNEDEITAREVDADGEVNIVMEPNFSLLSYSGDDELTIKRKGEELIAKRGKLEKRYNIGHRRWIQNFTFSFVPFLKSGADGTKFSVIRPKDLSHHTLLAKKRGIVDLELEGKTFKAIKIDLSLPGFIGVFWQAEAWFDPGTFFLLKYRGNSGPGTPTSTTTFVP